MSFEETISKFLEMLKDLLAPVFEWLRSIGILPALPEETTTNADFE